MAISTSPLSRKVTPPTQGSAPAPRRAVNWSSPYIKLAIVVAVGVVVAMLPVPRGLEPNAWRYFALFVAVIVGLIIEPVPAAAVGLVGVTAAAVMGLVFSPADRAVEGFDLPAEAIRWVLSGFSNSTVWLIFGAFMFALGYEKTGLGQRIALLLVKTLGKRTLGLGYAVAIADLVLSPFTPSNTARSGGTIFPVIRNIPPLYGSYPGESARKIGTYLMWTAFAATCVTSSLFLTALAPNLLALELVESTTGVTISWTRWLVGMLPVGLLLLALVPWLSYKLAPPEVKSGTEVPEWAGKELGKMGSLTRNEKIMGGLVLLALGLWIFAGSFIDATLAALVVISLMVLTGVVRWEDITANKSAWNVLVWFATLVTLAGGLNRVGFIKWFAGGAATLMGGMSPLVIMVLLVVLFYVMHYMFASTTAHTTALLPVFLVAGAAVPGLPLPIFAMLLCFSLGLMGVISPYATGPSPVYFGSGYISRKDFWTLGLIFGAIFLVVLLAVGVPWLLMLGA
jgi:L-tartrate/succinate antiporter